MKRNNKEISGNPGGDARQPAQNGIQGSTIIAVLAAMLFIGIVTASMVKNTGSQSAASIGYGTMHTMNSTAKSGMVATETFFGMGRADDDNTVTALISRFLNAPPNGGNASKVFIFNDDKKKTGLGNSNQFFNSEIVEVIPAPTPLDTMYLAFRLGSGRTQDGKDLKKAMAFYSSTRDVIITNTSTFGAQNALYSNGPVENFDAGVEVMRDPVTGRGQVTFEGDMHLNSTNKMIFHDNVYVGGNASFNDKAEFNDKVYFNGNVKMNQQAVGSVFNDRVGINGNFEGPAATFNFNDDVWFNGNFTGANNSKFGTTTGSNFFYTDKIPIKTEAMAYGGCKLDPVVKCAAGVLPTQSAPCCPHLDGHKTTSDILVDSANGGFANLCQGCQPPGYVGPNIDLATFQNRLEMGNLDVAARRDPQLDMDFATDKNQGGADPYTLKQVMDLGGATGSAINANILNKAYDEAKDAGRLTEDGYMVVKLGSDAQDNWYNWNSPGTTPFEKKVIFIAEGNYGWSGQYFPTTSESSTLIYMGGNAALAELKINGTFNGLIYVDADNTASANGGSHIIKAAPDAMIVGAIHNHSNNNIQWNGGNNPTPPKIQFSEAALNRFARMSKGGTPGNWQTQYSNTNVENRIRLRPMGYYFY